MLTTTTTSPLAAAIKRLAITKDAKRVMLALADADEWTPVTALETLLGKSKVAVKRMVEAVTFLLREHLAESRRDGENEIYLRACRVEEWDKDEHFLLGTEIAWP
jgi:hypothetical protein